MAIIPTRIEGDGVPPALLFCPSGDHDALPLVLLGHGAHLSKDDPVMQILAKGFCRGVPAAVALMDCPGHGERRAPGSSDAEFDADVQRRMTDAKNYAQVRDDWIAVERAVRGGDPRITGPTGYAGFSMGAMFGLAIVADLPSVTTAVFALGGLTTNETRNALIRGGAVRLGDREVLMLNMTRDEHFAMEGALEIFEAIPGPKRMGVWAGTHVDIPPEAIELAIALFQRDFVGRP
jgi:pimeloyl-ACP methyl ester carboxylesterase